MSEAAQKPDELFKARLDKLRRWRDEFEIDGYGQRTDGLIPLAEARAMFDEAADDVWRAAEDAEESIDDPRPQVLVAGRCVQHREMGKLAFLVIRDATGDLQVSCSRGDLETNSFRLARKLDYGDVIVAGGRMGRTRKGEICVWADRFELASKSLQPPPEKWHGLQDPELRARRRHVDLFTNPEVLQTFTARSQIISSIRRRMDARGFLEVETPMMHPVPGGAAARPFTTHHNALGMPLFLRIAPELYLKKLIVGGLPKVYEINRNFRNEGVDRSHNPEFTAMEVYEAFSDHHGMADLTESICREVAEELSGGIAVRPFGEIEIDWSSPFVRLDWREAFTKVLGFDPSDEAKVREAAQGLVENAATADVWVLANALFEERVEPTFDPSRPTFVFDYPSVISPLTRSYADRPEYCGRWDLFAGGMELGTAYTELNDPLEQRRRFEEQLGGMDDEMAKERTLDESFLDALETGMPPTGGLGIGIDRVVMLLVNATSIRDVIYFPLLRPESASEENPCDE